MKYIQTLLLAGASVGLLACLSTACHAADSFYVVAGKSVPAMQAMTAAASGQDVFQCKPVELKVSKSGTSVSLHAKKQAKRN